MASGPSNGVASSPLEMLFQSKTAKTKSKVLRNAKLPKDLDMSATVGPKGSYREEHVVAYLERWLQPWSEERQAAGDWRIMYMDAYKAHLTDRIEELCCPRGYVCLYHYGLTTGIAQVNDTDLHGEFSRIFRSSNWPASRGSSWKILRAFRVVRISRL